MPDKILRCIDCRSEFVFTEKEQGEYADRVDRKTGRAWTDPIRCPPCRRERRMNREKQDQQRG